jgi:uncharacterized protein YecT (DUF1311 family)
MKLLSFFLLFVFLSFGTQAASFDCASKDIVRDIDQFICSDHEISNLDEKMGRLYQETYKKLSSTNRVTFLNNQREWLNYWPGACLRGVDSKETLQSQQANACVKDEYERRIEELKLTQNHQSWIIFQVSRYSLTKAKKDQVPKDIRFLQHQLRFPQIETQGLDGQSQQTAVKINGWITQAIRKRGLKLRTSLNEDTMDSLMWARLQDPSPDIQTLHTIYYFNAFGTHGNSEFSNFHYMISKDRDLRTDDLMQGKWQEFLAQKTYTQLKQNIPDNLFIDSDKALYLSIQRIENWAFYKEGLEIIFSPYEVAQYVAGSPSVMIPWAELDLYLTTYGRSQLALIQDAKSNSEY